MDIRLLAEEQELVYADPPPTEVNAVVSQVMWTHELSDDEEKLTFSSGDLSLALELDGFCAWETEKADLQQEHAGAATITVYAISDRKEEGFGAALSPLQRIMRKIMLDWSAMSQDIVDYMWEESLEGNWIETDTSQAWSKETFTAQLYLSGFFFQQDDTFIIQLSGRQHYLDGHWIRATFKLDGTIVSSHVC